MNFSDNSKGFLFCIASGLLYGPMGYFGMQLINDGSSITNMLFWRYLVAVIFIFIVLVPKIKYMRIDPKIFLSQLVLGIVFYGSFSLLYFQACLYIGTGLAIVIFFTFPAFVMSFNWIIYQNPAPRIYYVSLITILFGMIMLIDLAEMKADLRGIGLAIFSAAGYACYIVFSKSHINSSPPITSTLTISIGGCIFAIIASNIDGTFYVPTSFEVWKNIIGLGIISTALPILFLLEGMRYVSSEKAAFLSVLEPVFVFTIGVTALNETVSSNEAIGALIIITGAMLVQLDRRPDEARTS
jgi:drug/metabolite transporter (DMT)-like permease